VNSLVNQLKSTDSLTIESLKGLYRSLALKLHPDVTRKSGEEFVRLQEEYDDALKYLLSRRGSWEKELNKAHRAALDSRTEFLRAFYIFSINYYGKHWRKLVPELTRLAKAYSPQIGRLISDFCNAFLQTGREVTLQGPVGVANDILLTTMKRLACYYEDGLPHNRRLIESYLKELDEKSKRLDLLRRMCIVGMTAWMREELEGKKVSLMTI
jgi:hypothetical protein